MQLRGYWRGFKVVGMIKGCFWGLKFSILRFFEAKKINLLSMYVFEWLDLRRKFFFVAGVRVIVIVSPREGI